MRIDETDKKWLNLAAELAGKGRGRVNPNPMVGCVLVQNNELISEGWHSEYGGPHAEVMAVQNAEVSVTGSTAYVSLEPCNHHGKTGPCSEYLIEAGVQRVVFGAPEAGSIAKGGSKRLKEAGIEVCGPIKEFSLGEGVDPGYFFNARHDRTYLALKLAVSADYKISSKPGERTCLTGPESNDEVHWIRSGFDGIMVGANTVRVDDPLLTVRGRSLNPRIPPTRIVISTDGDLPVKGNLFDDTDVAPVLVIVSEKASGENIDMLKCSGARVEVVRSIDEKVDLSEAMDLMWTEGIKSILCEGGAELSESMCSLDLVQRLYLFRTVPILGPNAVSVFCEDTAPWGSEGWRTTGGPRILGRDSLITYDRESKCLLV